MTRGIHLKRLSTTDLRAIGLREDQVNHAQGSETPLGCERSNRLAEADPALSLLVCEVRERLEMTLQLLDQALELGSRDETA
jgi:hypothetical protein